MSGQPLSPDAEALRDEAIAWLVRVQSDAATGDDWAALADWLDGSDARQAAFEAAEQLSAVLDADAAAIARGIAEPMGQVIAFRPRKTAPVVSRPVWGALIAASLVLLAGPVVWQASLGTPVTYSTAPGETREVTLSDGSHIHLAAASELTARIGWRARRVSMASAEATFDVAHDPNKPFLISVGDQQVKVVGTEFNIRHYADQVVVTVRRGIVEVRQPKLGALPVARLTVGQQLSHRVGAPTSRQTRVNPAVAFAWTEGRLICEDRPLSEIVADLNRRYASRIQVSGAAGRKRFSGVLTLDDQDQVVRRLADYLSLTVERREGTVLLR